MLLKEVRRLCRGTELLAHVLLGMFISVAILPLPIRARLSRWILRWWLKRTAAILRVRVMCRGTPLQEASLLAANHISWLDILVLTSQCDAGFVTKADVNGWPLIGWLAEMSESELMQRGSPDSAARLLQRMVQRLKQGERLAVFAEGTSRLQVVPDRYRPGLLQAAVAAGVHVQPVAIYYGADEEDLRRVACVKEETFLHHLWRLLGTGAVLVEVTFLPPLSAILGDSRLMADKAWNAVRYTLRRLELYEHEAAHRNSNPNDATLTQAV